MREGEGEERGDKSAEVNEKCGDKAEFNGTHYHVTLDKIEYKNANTLSSKRHVYEQNREKGRQYFGDKKYDLAAKVYKNSIHITENLPRGKFSADELREIDDMNAKSKQNFLKCYLKLEAGDERT